MDVLTNLIVIIILKYVDILNHLKLTQCYIQLYLSKAEGRKELPSVVLTLIHYNDSL